LKNPIRAASLPLIALVLASLLSLDGCTAVAIAYYYRHRNDCTRWACSHDQAADHCTLKVADGEVEVSSLVEASAASGAASQGDMGSSQYVLTVRFIAGKAPLSAALFKTHLLLPDDSVLVPAAVAETDDVADTGRQEVGADPELIPAQQQRSFELQFPLHELPEAYLLSLAPIDASGSQHGPPMLAMRIEYGPDQ